MAPGGRPAGAAGQGNARAALRHPGLAGVSELVGLTAEHVQPAPGAGAGGGQGNKEQLVPMGEEAVHWLERALLPGRRAPCCWGHQLGRGVPLQAGRMMTRQTFWHRIKLYAQRAGIRGTLPHTLRHAATAHLLSTAPTCGWCRCCCWATRISPPPGSTPRGQQAAPGAAQPASPARACSGGDFSCWFCCVLSRSYLR